MQSSLHGTLFLASERPPKSTRGGAEQRSDLFLAAWSFRGWGTPHTEPTSPQMLYFWDQIWVKVAEQGQPLGLRKEAWGKLRGGPHLGSSGKLPLGPDWKDRVSPGLGKGDPDSRSLGERLERVSWSLQEWGTPECGVLGCLMSSTGWCP